MTAKDFRSSWLWRGHPYCDTCRQPAVVNPFHGVIHVTVAEPGGVDPNTDDHPATIRAWEKGETA